MPYLVEKHNDEESAKRAAKTNPPLGPGFPEEIVQRTVGLEIWGSRFGDPGGDWCDFLAFDADGALIGERRISGH